MTTEMEKHEINDCLVIIDRLMPLISEAERQFSSARNWGFLDMLGGGLITDIIKHTKLSRAAGCMNEINYLLRDLERELKDVKFTTDYSMNTGSFSTFADFLFDGILADTYMQSKIMNSLDQVRELHHRIEYIQTRLLDMKNR
ncbi:MAG: hypothetical protein MJ182_08515 [Treponema sp.]|nr:hypothetical protein [Treponema sp.]